MKLILLHVFQFELVQIFEVRVVSVYKILVLGSDL